MTDQKYIDICARYQELARFAGGITPSVILMEPSRDELIAVAEDLRLLAHKVDALVSAYGAYVANNVPEYVDQSIFEDVFSDALQNALDLIEDAADDIAAEQAGT